MPCPVIVGCSVDGALMDGDIANELGKLVLSLDGDDVVAGLSFGKVVGDKPTDGIFVAASFGVGCAVVLVGDVPCEG